MKTHRIILGLAICAPLFGACSSNSSPNKGGAGGNHATGGATDEASLQGGSTSVAEGGSPTTGGPSSLPDTGGSGSGGMPATGGSVGTAPVHWVGTWTASPYYDSANQPPVSLGNAVLRQVTHVSLGGSKLRVQFSNLFGNGPVTINSVHIALCKAAPAVDSTIDTSTDKALAFTGAASVTIDKGKEVWSDPIDFALPSLSNLTITTAFASVPTSVTGHSGSRTTSYIQAGSSEVSAASMTSATKTDHWYYISGIDVAADPSSMAIVAIGDSLTDGRGTDTNKNNRWTDDLAIRLLANAATANVAVLNQGIGATALVGTGGTAAQARFNRDVLGQSSVKWAIIFDGVNDIGGGTSAATIQSVYAQLIAAGHANGVRVYGATITPFGSSSYYSDAHEAVRQQVNQYIKSGAFDGYLDFDAAVTDNGTPPKLQTAYATWAQTDYLHLSPAGYQKLADSVDLSLFAP